jgi:hypothetical protein
MERSALAQELLEELTQRRSLLGEFSRLDWPIIHRCGFLWISGLVFTFPHLWFRHAWKCENAGFCACCAPDGPREAWREQWSEWPIQSNSPW